MLPQQREASGGHAALVETLRCWSFATSRTYITLHERGAFLHPLGL